MNKKVLNIITYFLFFCIGIGLFWYLYRDQKIETIIAGLNGINYWWILLSMVLGLLSHVIRAVRWKMLVEPLGYKPAFLNSFFSVMIAYFANLALPRLGEISRPAVISKYEKIPFPQAFGTIVIERIIDLIILFLLTVTVLIVEYDVIVKFIENNPDVKDKFQGIIKLLAIIAIIGTVLLILFLLFFRKKINKTKIYCKIKELLLKFLDGIKTIRKLKKLPLFILHSIFIWLMYYLMMYVCFFAFDFTSHLGLLAGLTLFMMGSYGMVAPVQGGIGPWHFMVIGTLLIFSIDFNDAKLFALVNHGTQILLIIIVGTISLIALPIYNKRKR